MLDSLTLTRVPGNATTLDSWTAAVTSGGKSGNFTIKNIPSISALADSLGSLLMTIDTALNLQSGTLVVDASTQKVK